MGRPLAARLLAGGEAVVDVPAKLGALHGKLKALTRRLRQAVTAAGSGLMDRYGIGPAGAARILADVGDTLDHPVRQGRGRETR